MTTGGDAVDGHDDEEGRKVLSIGKIGFDAI
jgi:hypothetical protein